MKAAHLEILVEEPFMEAFLMELLPRVLGAEQSFSVYPYQGKDDLLDKLPQRLKGYAAWLPADWRIVVIVEMAREMGRVMDWKSNRSHSFRVFREALLEAVA